MHRRQFILDALTGLPVLWTSSLLASSCQQGTAVAPNGKTVIVVGAGISGLAAAKKLKERGFTVTVLEA